MRICLINNLYGAAARGGAERIVELEAKALAAHSHAVAVVSVVRSAEVSGAVCAPTGCGPSSRSIQEGEVTHLTFVAPNLFAYADLGRHGFAARLVWHFADMFNFAAAARLRRLLREVRPDIVHTHNLMGVGFLTARLLRHLRLRHVHTVHDVQLLHPSGLIRQEDARRPSIGRRTYATVMAALMGSPETVIFPSDFLESLHTESGFFPGSKMVVLRNPSPVFGTDHRHVPLERRFLFIGQLEPHKGIRTLLDAWKMADPDGAVLELAGRGSLDGEVDRAIDRSLGTRALGRLSAEEVRKVLATAYCLVFVSEVIENAPTIILEAFAAGVPVIATAVGGVPELVQDGVNGLLTSAGDAQGLSLKIKEMMALPPARWETLSAAALVSARATDLSAHVNRLEAIYRSG